MTRTLAKAFQEASKLPSKEQEIFADFILDELAFRAAVREGIEAADRGEAVPLEEVKKMIPKWASK
jgi:predicted transcriptional regulator